MSENVVARFGTVFVTQSRVREQDAHSLRSAFLHEVDAAGTQRTHHPWLIAVALASLLAALVLGESNASIALFPGLIAVAAGLAYLVTREVRLTIWAGSMSLHTKLQSGSARQAEEFIDALEAAKERWEAERGR